MLASKSDQLGFGQLAEMERILELGRDLGIPVIEDASQAHGAQSESGSKAGSFGVAGAFSFYPSKNLGAWGDSGAVVTNDDALANEIRSLREHGQVRKYVHSKLGWNGRMDGIQAAVLEIKLRNLEANNEARRLIADRYEMILRGCPGLVTPGCDSRLAHVFHLYSLLIEEREANIGVGVGFEMYFGPVPDRPCPPKGFTPTTAPTMLRFI